MNVESQKKLCVGCIFGFIVLLVIIIVGWFQWPAPKPQAENVHEVRISYDARNRLEFADDQGNRIEPVVLPKDRSIQALFKDREIVSIVPAAILDVKLNNPKCKPMILSDGLCVAPHTYCCQL